MRTLAQRPAGGNSATATIVAVMGYALSATATVATSFPVEARPVSALAAFTASCEARALLYTAGELDLHEAVDELQRRAASNGLIADLGQDQVQAVMSAAFGAVRNLDGAEDFDAECLWDAPSWTTAAEEYRANPPSPPDPQTIARCRRLLEAEFSPERIWHEIERQRLAGRAASSSVDALVRSLRERGEAALAEPDCRCRLAELSSAQVREVIGRLMALRPNCPAISDNLLLFLGEQLS